LPEAELAEWARTADTLVTGFDPTTGVFEQFAGYFGLEDIDLANYADRTAPMDVVLGRERTQRSQVVKQADVVALLALQVEPFSHPVQRANFDYYAPRCGHGSSLSRAMHAIAAARLGDPSLALRYFHDSAALDLSDATGAAGGVHIAALGGLWQVAVFGFGGLAFDADTLQFDPRLPNGWQQLRFVVQWRGRKVSVCIDAAAGHFNATLSQGAAMSVTVSGASHELRPGRPLQVNLNP
jgi:trehalose/maltose hydrolase-like predicted phosphorylase